MIYSVTCLAQRALLVPLSDPIPTGIPVADLYFIVGSVGTVKEGGKDSLTRAIKPGIKTIQELDDLGGIN